MTQCRRINMWAGPRNVSTAMMYSWRQRSDTVVWDEPMYGRYLVRSGVEHALRDEIVATVPTRADEIIDLMLNRPCSRDVWFYKNMAHHLAGFDLRVFDDLEGFLLTRDPRDMLPSLALGLGRVPEMSDTGFDHQVEVVDRWLEIGRTPLVVDSRALLSDPGGVLERLCAGLGLEFEDSMLSWPSGSKPEDGVWARHWYASVHRSTGFEPYRPKEGDLAESLRSIHSRCAPLYERLSEFMV